jgi:hypothetical protein
MKVRLALVLLLSSSAFAQSRFNGTWEMKMDTLQFSGSPEEYLIADGMYHCVSCIPQVDVKADGTDYAVAGHEMFYDTIAARVVDNSSVELTFKKGGQPAAISTETVSSDGRTMIETFTNNIQRGAVVGNAHFLRVSEGPSGSHILSGKWAMQTVKNATRAGTLTTYRLRAGTMTISDGSQSYSAKLDGQQYPLGDFGNATVSLKLITPSTMEETDRLEGKVISVTRSTVSPDGRSMKVEMINKQHGQTMTYTAVKIRRSAGAGPNRSVK